MPWSHQLQQRLRALWSHEEVAIPADLSGWAVKCDQCSAGDPYNDWYVWDDATYVQRHAQIAQWASRLSTRREAGSGKDQRQRTEQTRRPRQT